ncbi:MAG: 2-oxoacid:acceptor oxidoreductase family protein, partial [Gemmatimonadetes bacterium]|nr:2-oxoacid:acceptor oxidoreductase family protein [Gemmatimonadota bacterium]
MRVLVGDDTAVQTRAEQSRIRTTRQPQCTVEVVSDSGEGAQKCGQTFGAVSAKMGNGVWTVEIIPAEIQPPPRSPAGASGNRIRIGEGVVTNWGDRTNVAIAFNEQVLLARHRLDAIEEDAILLVENMWATHKDEDIRAEWAAAMDELGQANYR